MRFDANSSFRDNIAMNTRQDPFRPETGFVENLKWAAQVEYNENLSISGGRDSDLKRQQKATLTQYMVDGKISESEFNAFRRGDSPEDPYDWGHMAYYARNQLGLDVVTDEEIDENVRLSYAKDREKQAQVYNDASFLGKGGAMLGMFGTQALDPIYLPLYFTGAGGAARGASFLARLGKLAAIEAGVESAKQILVANHKSRIGSDYSAADAITAISGAAIGVGVFEVTGRVLGKALRKLGAKELGVFGADASPQDIAFAREQVNGFADLLENAPNPDAPARQILEEANAAATRLNQQTPRELAENILEDMPENTEGLTAELDKVVAEQPELTHFEKVVDAQGTETYVAKSTAEELTRIKDTQSQIDEAIKCFAGVI